MFNDKFTFQEKRGYYVCCATTKTIMDGVFDNIVMTKASMVYKTNEDVEIAWYSPVEPNCGWYAVNQDTGEILSFEGC